MLFWEVDNQMVNLDDYLKSSKMCDLDNPIIKSKSTKFDK